MNSNTLYLNSLKCVVQVCRLIFFAITNLTSKSKLSDKCWETLEEEKFQRLQNQSLEEK